MQGEDREKEGASRGLKRREPGRAGEGAMGQSWEEIMGLGSTVLRDGDRAEFPCVCCSCVVQGSRRVLWRLTLVIDF